MIKLSSMALVFSLSAQVNGSPVNEPGLAAEAPDKKISELSFYNTVLQDCVKREANNRGWTKASQVTSLSCASFPDKISDASGLSQLPSLNYLNLEGHELETFDTAEVKNVQVLNLSRNKLTSIDLSNGNDSLIELDVSYNQLTNITQPLNISRLMKLNAANNHLTVLGNSVSGNSFAYLTELDLSSNKISDFHLYPYERLRKINLSNNQLSGILSMSNASHYLRDINVDSNKLSEIFFPSGAHKHLENFSAKNNRIVKFTSHFSGHVNVNLRKLNLQGNLLTNVDLTDMKKLKELNLSDNQLADINISPARELEIVDVSLNQLENIGVNHNRKLKVLSVVGNAIMNGHLRTLGRKNIADLRTQKQYFTSKFGYMCNK